LNNSPSIEYVIMILNSFLGVDDGNASDEKLDTGQEQLENDGHDNKGEWRMVRP